MTQMVSYSNIIIVSIALQNRHITR